MSSLSERGERSRTNVIGMRGKEGGRQGERWLAFGGLNCWKRAGRFDVSASGGSYRCSTAALTAFFSRLLLFREIALPRVDTRYNVTMILVHLSRNRTLGERDRPTLALLVFISFSVHDLLSWRWTRRFRRGGTIPLPRTAFEGQTRISRLISPRDCRLPYVGRTLFRSEARVYARRERYS